MLTCPKCHLEYHEERATCLVDGATLIEVDDPRIGKLIGGRYQLDSVLGEGGMATVFRAHHTVIQRIVAVKLLHPHIAKDSRIRERFLREARSAASLAHPNVIEIYDFGDTEDGIPYLVMELLEGEPIRKLVDAGPLPIEVVIDLSVQLLRGLARAHDLGISHRDLKPENAFFQRRPDGSTVAKLVDFGIAFSRGDARLTDVGAIIGTPQYVAPERLRGHESGAPADLYSFGVMLFEMLTGRLPFEATTLPGWIAAHLDQTPPRPSSLRPDIPPALDAIVLTLLAKEPAQRPVDARAVLDAIEKARPRAQGRALGATLIRGGAGAPGGDLGLQEALRATELPPSPPPAPSGKEPPAMAATPPAPPVAPAAVVAVGPESGSAQPDARAATVSQPPPDPVHEPAPVPWPATRTQSLTFERWQRRTAILRRMLDQAFPAGGAPPALVAAMREAELALERMAKLRAERVEQQGRIDAIEIAAKESRERLGHAVHAVGEQLSQARLDLRQAEEVLEQRRNDVADLEYQITILREQLQDAEAESLDDRKELDERIAASGEEGERLRREVNTKTLAVLTAIRGIPALRPLVAELERSARD